MSLILRENALPLVHFTSALAHMPNGRSASHDTGLLIRKYYKQTVQHLLKVHFKIQIQVFYIYRGRFSKQTIQVIYVSLADRPFCTHTHTPWIISGHGEATGIWGMKTFLQSHDLTWAPHIQELRRKSYSYPIL